MSAFVHGCHLIPCDPPKAGEIPARVFAVATSDEKQLVLNDMPVFFTSIFRADQYFRRARKEQSYMVREMAVVDLVAIAAKHTVVVNPCACCAHQNILGAGSDGDSVVQTFIAQDASRARMYLKDAESALADKNYSLAIETLLVVIDHLAPDEIKAHELIAMAAQHTGEQALIDSAKTNIDLLKRKPE